MPIIHQEGGVAKQALTWLQWADDDYISARALLMSDLIVQGCILSNTAIEKYIKTLFFMKQLKPPKSHDVVKLYDQLKATGVNLQLNEGYLTALVKSYKLRYPDDLEIGFNIALSQTKLLAELDTTVFNIRKGFDFWDSGKNRKITTAFDTLLESKDNKLLEYNCSFGTFDRKRLFERDCHCYELRVMDNETTLQARYQTRGIEDDGLFNIEGLKPKDSAAGPATSDARE